jgi:hypothetical protein
MQAVDSAPEPRGRSRAALLKKMAQILQEVDRFRRARKP